MAWMDITDERIIGALSHIARSLTVEEMQTMEDYRQSYETYAHGMAMTQDEALIFYVGYFACLNVYITGQTIPPIPQKP